MLDKDVNIIIGKNIRIRRSLRGFSQSALAELLGITFQQVQKYEKGTNSVSPAKLLQLCQILECGIEDLFRDPISPGQKMPLPIPSRRSLHLVQYFERIESQEVQQHISDLVRALSKLSLHDKEVS